MARTADKGTHNSGLGTLSGTHGLATANDLGGDRAARSGQFHETLKLPRGGRKVMDSQKRGSSLLRGFDASEVSGDAAADSRYQHQSGGRSVLSSLRAEQNQGYKLVNKESFGASILKVM